MEPEAVGGFLDNLFASLKPDLTKIDKPKMKSSVSLGLDAMKPATTWPANFDDTLYDQLKDVCNKFIDNLGVKDSGPVTVGDVSEADVDAYLGKFPSVNEEVRQKLRKRPRTLKTLQENFTAEEQARLVGNPFLIGLLTIFGPMIVELIKKWLSK